MEDKELMAERLKAFQNYLEVLSVYEDKMLAMDIYARANDLRIWSKGYEDYSKLIGLDVARSNFQQEIRQLEKIGFSVQCTFTRALNRKWLE